MKKIKISIIIPVYNVEKYIKVCLNSVLNQTIEDKEIILINDASIDNSLKIIKDYEKLYPKMIKVINLGENKGQSYCRNLGIDISVGEYIGFVDSDDIVSPNMFEQLVKNAINGNSDIAMTEFNVYGENIKQDDLKSINNYNINKDIKFESISTIKALKKFLKGEITGSPCTKIYKRNLLVENNIRFPVGRYYEDMQVILSSIINSKNIIINNDKLYYYRNNSSSTTKRNITKKHIYSIEKAIQDINELYTNTQMRELNNSKINYDIWINSMLIDNQILFKIDNNLDIDIKDSKGIYNIKKLKFFNVMFAKDVILKNKLNYILIKLNSYIYLKTFKQRIKKTILK
ncbi:glycosyltransferase family 2 protein [Terrisporobacter vanillatitrophus]|uniref:glycosyltransferase family 2 protein n=1 Tax=Terrisporobacter vanillatitrophus TaxID=3058402 RepID=UPI003365F43D